jgi:hypothetical protein
MTLGIAEFKDSFLFPMSTNCILLVAESTIFGLRSSSIACPHDRNFAPGFVAPDFAQKSAYLSSMQV